MGQLEQSETNRDERADGLTGYGVTGYGVTVRGCLIPPMDHYQLSGSPVCSVQSS